MRLCSNKYLIYVTFLWNCFLMAFLKTVNTVAMVRWNIRNTCTIFLDFMRSSYQCELLSFIIFAIFCLFPPGLIRYVLVSNYMSDCRVLKYIDDTKKEIEAELKQLVKLCRWDHAKSYLSIENLKRCRQKLRKLVQKYTVSLNLSFSFLVEGIIIFPAFIQNKIN